jgi:hypothetical protein
MDLAALAGFAAVAGAGLLGLLARAGRLPGGTKRRKRIAIASCRELVAGGGGDHFGADAVDDALLYAELRARDVDFDVGASRDRGGGGGGGGG